MEPYLDNFLIITAVEKYPCLYDKNQSHFKHLKMRKDSWRNVTKEVLHEEWDQMDEATRLYMGKLVQKRWLTLRAQFLKSLNELEKCQSVGKMKRPYRYLRYMGFLVPERQTLLFSLLQRGSRKLTPSSRNQNEASSTYKPAGYSSTQPTYKPTGYSSYATSESSGNLDTEENDEPPATGVRKPTKLVLTKTFQKYSTTLKKDPDRMFLLSQLPLIKRMTPGNKLQFQIAFAELIRKYSNNPAQSATKANSVFYRPNPDAGKTVSPNITYVTNHNSARSSNMSPACHSSIKGISTSVCNVQPQGMTRPAPLREEASAVLHILNL